MPTSENKSHCVRFRIYQTACIISICINNLRRGVRGYTVLVVTAALVGKMSVRGVRRAFRPVRATLPQILRPFVHHPRHSGDAWDYLEQKWNMSTVQHLFSLSLCPARVCAAAPPCAPVCIPPLDRARVPSAPLHISTPLTALLGFHRMFKVNVQVCVILVLCSLIN